MADTIDLHPDVLDRLHGIELQLAHLMDEVIVVSRCPLRTDSGKSLSNQSFIAGLWSNRSIWAGPPTM